MSEEGEQRPVITMVMMDRATSSTIFVRSDGKEARLSLDPSPFEATSALSRLHFTPALGSGLVAVTQAGDHILFELPSRDGANLLAGRLVVYLDQNQWSTVAKARHDPARVADEDRAAALRLAEWARHRRIVLPASAGHYSETTRWAAAGARHDLGLTILQLSRGWQMRDAIQVRRDELRDTLRRRSAGATATRDAAVFTLDPNAVYDSWRGGDRYAPPPDFPADAAFFCEALTSAASLIDTMLDTECVEPGPEAGWVGANQRFSDWLDGENRDSRQKRKVVDAWLLSDLRTEIAEEARAAGVTLEQLERWVLNHFAADIRGLPATGLFREVLHDRHLNRGIVWRINDLTDMVYLSCAAGYADFVVCERHMCGVLAQGLRRLGRRQNVFRRLRDAVPAIEAALAASSR